MSPLGRSPMKGGICHVRGFESLNYLKPYWLTIIILITRRPLNQVSDCISLLRLTWILSGSFFVASYYIIRLKNIFYKLFSNFLNFFYTGRNWDDFIYTCAYVWPCVVFLCILGILRAATCACMCAYILSFKSEQFHLGLDYWAVGLWFLYIYFIK